MKRRIEPYREFAVLLHRLLTWEEQYFAAIIFAFVTVVYIFVWYLDVTMLTGLALFALLCVGFDFMAPILTNACFDASKWDGAKEKQFEQFCQLLLHLGGCCKCAWSGVRKLKHDRPFVYLISAVVGLLLLAWIGETFNSLFLCFLGDVSLAMAPGLVASGLWEQYCAPHLKTVLSLVKRPKKE